MSDSEDNDVESIGVPAQKKRKYSAEFKLKIVKLAKAGSIKSVAKKNKLDRKTIREWIRDEEKIQEQT